MPDGREHDETEVDIVGCIGILIFLASCYVLYCITP